VFLTEIGCFFSNYLRELLINAGFALMLIAHLALTLFRIGKNCDAFFALKGGWMRGGCRRGGGGGGRRRSDLNY
jgi:hypothetical protein